MSRGSPGLTPSEKAGIRELLDEFLPEVELTALLRTVTLGRIIPEDRKEAVDIILLHTDRPGDLLSRKKITADVLLRYLCKHKVSVGSKQTKVHLIESVLDLWGSSSFSSVPISRRHGEEASSSPVRIEEVEDEIVPYRGGPAAILTGVQKIAFAHEFVRWFYQMLGTDDGLRDFGEHHFWTDARMTVTNVGPSGAMTIPQQQVEGASSVAAFYLGQLNRPEGRVIFSPSADGVVDVREEDGGVVSLMVRGTVNVGPFWVGIFEQNFRLIQDPSVAGNSWKIKATSLNIASSGTAAALTTPTPQPMVEFMEG